MKKFVIILCCLFGAIITIQVYAQSASSVPSQTRPGRILVAYFTQQSSGSGVDVITGGSKMVIGGNQIGHTRHVANTIQRLAGGDLFEIQTVQTYPYEHPQLLEMAQHELRQNARPRLATRIPNLQDYDTIILGYPNWWRDMPMPVYSFLTEHNFEGKTIIPFMTHGGSGFSGTVERIAQLQPQATVRDALLVHRSNLTRSESDISAWLRRIGILQ
jgi:flavodoxin